MWQGVRMAMRSIPNEGLKKQLAPNRVARDPWTGRGTEEGEMAMKSIKIKVKKVESVLATDGICPIHD
jgi:hypothetical protein